MKTKLFLIILPALLLLNTGYAQPATYCRSLEVTIVATSNFEESRQELMKMSQLPNVLIASMSEIKDGSNPMIFDLEIYTDEKGYSLFDESFEKLGHVSFKNASLSLASEPTDTLLLRNEMEQNNQLISVLTEKIAVCADLKDLLPKIIDLQNKNKKIRYEIRTIKASQAYSNFLIIHLNN